MEPITIKNGFTLLNVYKDWQKATGKDKDMLRGRFAATYNDLIKT